MSKSNRHHELPRILVVHVRVDLHGMLVPVVLPAAHHEYAAEIHSGIGH